MSPDEEPGGVAVEEAPPEPGEPSPEAVPEAQEPPVDEATPDQEAAPEAEPKDAGEGGAQEDEAEESPADLFAKLVEIDPALADEFIEKLPADQKARFQPPDDQGVAVQQARTQRLTDLHQRKAEIDQLEQVFDAAAWERDGKDLDQRIRAGAEKLRTTGEGDVASLLTNAQGRSVDLGTELSRLAQAGIELGKRRTNYGWAMAEDAATKALEDDATHKALPKEFRDGWGKLSLADRIRAQLYFASASAPENVRAQTRQQLEKELNYAESVAKLKERVGTGNGRKATKGGGGGSGQPKNETEARNWHATGKWTDSQMRAYLTGG